MFKQNNKYIAFNKPLNVLSQFTDEGSGKKTLSLFDFPKDVYPVGRLDYDSEGLIILSNDNELNNSLLSPNNKKSKTYIVQVENIPNNESLNQIRSGIIVQNYRTKPAQVKIIDTLIGLLDREIPIRVRKNIPTTFLELSINEGKNRQVRKMTAKIGCPTLRLYRVKIGKLDIRELGLKFGEWVELTESQYDLLFL
ncbi:MAG: pseudouridine synthase [Chlorobiota bacterium]|nr:pseudouridine synthase [Chlorobiota bacterium]QQS67694.1 MAG: pseudouridine synthase [Chlorobiota bacterium]